MVDEESSGASLNATTQPDVRTIFVGLLGEVKKMNENFTNIPYVDEDEPLLSSTTQNKDEATNDIDGVETASLDVQVAHLTAKQPDYDLLDAIAQDLDVREKTGSAISDGLAGILTSLLNTIQYITIQYNLFPLDLIKYLIITYIYRANDVTIVLSKSV